MDLIKHQSVFDPAELGLARVLVIGAGAVGSSVALGLAKLGLTRITLLDADRVEAHNISNQYIYGPDDVGEFKVDAAARRIHEATGTSVDTMARMYEGARLAHEYVFMCVDRMSVRQDIVSRGARINPTVRYLFDTRIDAYNTMSYAFEPSDLRQVAAWQATWYSDADANPALGTCGNVMSIGATAQIGSQTTLWLFMQAAKNLLSANEILISTAPEWSMLSRRFDRAAGRRAA